MTRSCAANERGAVVGVISTAILVVTKSEKFLSRPHKYAGLEAVERWAYELRWRDGAGADQVIGIGPRDLAEWMGIKLSRCMQSLTLTDVAVDRCYDIIDGTLVLTARAKRYTVGARRMCAV